MSNPFAGYLTAGQFAKRHGYTARRVQQWLAKGRIIGAVPLPNGQFLIPETAALPTSGIGGNPDFKPGKRRKRRAQRKAG